MILNATLVSIQSRHASKPYGQLGTVPLGTGARGLLAVAIPADIPAEAVVTRAELVFATKEAWPGPTRALSAQLAGAQWTPSRATWGNQPAVAAGSVAHTTDVPASPAGQRVTIDVLDDTQAIIAGAALNRGWLIKSTDATPRGVKGSKAATGAPVLELDYALPSTPPTDLHPAGGAVSVAKPTLRFRGFDMIGLQIQIDPDADESTAWDSGEQPASAGLFNLAASSYPGLALDASTSWRARRLTVAGLSDWSDWATFPRTAKPDLVITGPGETTGDKTAPITWTCPDQVAFQGWLYDHLTGRLLADSGLVPTTEHEWTPPAGLTVVGQRGRAVVQGYDAVDRELTPGDPPWAEDVHEFDLVAAGDADGVTDLTATVDGPITSFAWDAITADEWQIERDDTWTERIDGSLRAFDDLTSAPFRTHTYRVLPVADGVVSPNGPSVTVTPRPLGIWLIDVETRDDVVLLAAEDLAVVMPETSVLHEVSGDLPPVRRRSGIRPPQGSISGLIVDALGRDHDTTRDRLWDFKHGDAGRLYRLVLGEWNMLVTIGEVLPSPSPVVNRATTASFSWWQAETARPWGS